uniref:ATP synthase complex subunit 8 n=1 Tax=Agrilus mali TaxID=1917227 RepID=A0A6M5A4X3_9COLE|nr:ATP synthase F0 subunit 8 [Agrilus mali]
MPQMAPMSWLTLFIVFSITFFVFCVFNYYSSMHAPMQSLSKKLQTKKINWKW